jgi:Zn-dependent protease with chaperone function
MVRVFEKLEEEQHRQLESMKKNKSKNENKSDPKEKKSAKKDSKEKDEEDKITDDEGITLPEWTKYLSTHPKGDDRVEVLKKMSKHPPHKSEPLLPGFDWKSMHRETKESNFIF